MLFSNAMKRINFSSLRATFKKTHFPIYVLISINLLIGMAIVSDFGESWDEKHYIIYGEDSLSNYQLFGGEIKDINLGQGNLRYYGPSYIMFSNMFDNIAKYLFPSLNSVDVYHFMYFISFQIGIFSLYWINTRFMSPWPAVASCLLFSTQPLLFGHAFINPKDIPFLGLFLATIASGLSMVDRFVELDKEYSSTPIDGVEPQGRGTIGAALHVPLRYKPSIVKNISYLLIAMILLLILSYYMKEEINSIISHLLTQIASGNSYQFMSDFHQYFSENSPGYVNSEYINKGLVLFWRSYYYINFLIIVLLILINVHPPKSNFIKLWDTIKLYYKEIIFGLPKKIIRNFSIAHLLFAGLILGLSTSIRILGPAAGAIVSIIMLIELRHKSIAPVIAYFLIGSFVAYLTWPFLWGAPINRFVESLTTMSDFPWDGQVLFDGILYFASELPKIYLPTLLIIQFTEPLILFFAGGCALVIINSFKRKFIHRYVLILFLWFWFPLIIIIIKNPSMYDNYRQLLFLTPPIFIFSGIFLDMIYIRLDRFWIFGVFILVSITPGIIAGVRLHPYEYVYYNSLIGGVSGANGRYELDYWATSFREATEYINDIAVENARILVYGPVEIAKFYAREDLEFENVLSIEATRVADFDYALFSTRQYRGIPNKVKAKINGQIIFRVSREDSVFTFVQEISD